MVVVAEVMGLEHAPDFERWHDAEVTVDADVVHAHVVFDHLAPSVVAMVLIDLLDTVTQSREQTRNIIKSIKHINRKKKFAKKTLDLSNQRGE